MNSIYNQSLNNIMFGKYVSEQNKAWLNNSGISDEQNKVRVSSNIIINEASQTQNQNFWNKKKANKEHLRLAVLGLGISQGASKSE